MASEARPPEMVAGDYPAQREFALPASTEAISNTVDEMMAFIAASGGAAGHEGEIMLALQEALCNAVIHGCGEDPAKTVRCRVGCGGTAGVLIAVRDEGPGFIPGEVASPLSANGLAADHGRGIHMICGLMDDVRFRHNGTEILMWKK